MTDWVNIAACFFCFACYELYLHRVSVQTPMKTARSAHAAIRATWVKSVMNKPGTEILVIQTLRNSVMAASFMATTAVLALSALLTLSDVGSASNGLWQSFRVGDHASMVFVAKLLLVAGSYFVSFLFTAMSVRFFNHAGYLITGDPGTNGADHQQKLAIAYLNRAGNLYSLGLRTFFCCLPFLAGLFSTYLMLPVTVILIAMLYWFDCVPAGER